MSFTLENNGPLVTVHPLQMVGIHRMHPALFRIIEEEKSYLNACGEIRWKRMPTEKTTSMSK